MKQKWNYLNQLSGRCNKTNKIDHLDVNGAKVSDQQIIYDELSNFFKKIPSEVHAKISAPKKSYMNLVPHVPSTIFIRPPTPGEIVTITNSL